MATSIPDPAPIQPSEIEIVRSEFASERLEIEQKYLRLQKTVDKAKSNALVHKRKVKRMIEVCAMTKNENENLYIANKKLCGQVKDTRIGRFFGTQ